MEPAELEHQVPEDQTTDYEAHHYGTFDMGADPVESPEYNQMSSVDFTGEGLEDYSEPNPDDANSYDLWVNAEYATGGASEDQQYYYDESQEQNVGSGEEPIPEHASFENEEYEYDPCPYPDSTFDETFFAAPSLQVFQIDETSSLEDYKPQPSNRPPRPQKRVPAEETTTSEHHNMDNNHWAWSPSCDSVPQETSLIRSAYSYSTNHLSQLQPTSRPQTADPLRPLHLTDTVDDGDEPYEISLLTPSIRLPRTSSPSQSQTTRPVTSHLKRPHSLPNGLRA
jgi:hypothetical protein